MPKKLTRVKLDAAQVCTSIKYDPANGCYGNAAKVGNGRVKPGQLSERQKVFVAEFIIDFNPTRAFRDAGYRTKNAQAKAYEVLNNPLVQKEIKYQLKRRQEERKMTSDRVIEELSKVALADIRDIFDDDGNIIHPKKMNETLAAAIASIEMFQKDRKDKSNERGVRNGQFMGQVKNIRRWDKMKALELLGRYLGMDKIKYELSGPGGTALVPPVFNVNFIEAPETKDKYRGTALDPTPPIR